MCGGCLEGIWKVSGRCLEECMQSMKKVSRQYKDNIYFSWLPGLIEDTISIPNRKYLYLLVVV